MIERKLHFNRFGVLTAKLLLKTAGIDRETEFLKSHKEKITEYFENEYAVKADASYGEKRGKKRNFRPFVLSVFYEKDGANRITVSVFSTKNDGEKAGFEDCHSFFSYEKEVFYHGPARRKMSRKSARM